MSSFKDEQAALLAESGWARCPSVAELVASAGLPAITAGYLDTAFDAGQWRAAEDSVAALREHFAGARFAGQVRYGVLLVPDPGRLDTRRPVPRDTRRDQPGARRGRVRPAAPGRRPRHTGWNALDLGGHRDRGLRPFSGLLPGSHRRARRHVHRARRGHQEADDQAAPGGAGVAVRVTPAGLRAQRESESYRSCGSSGTTGHWRVPEGRPGGG
ncbi:MAG: hypothetical protein J2P20_09775 [Pseudonocardia sp.]|nr:hypothetical protein [Pseudonocardia sp.]